MLAENTVLAEKTVLAENKGVALLAGLDAELESELAEAMEKAGLHCLHSNLDTLAADLKALNAAVVFCGCNRSSYQSAVDSCRPKPVVVVTRSPDVSGWLDAMDYGASDYCAAPFEPPLVEWLVHNLLPNGA